MSMEHVTQQILNIRIVAVVSMGRYISQQLVTLSIRKCKIEYII